MYPIIQIVSSSAVSLSILAIALAVLIAFQRKNRNRGFNFFIAGFFSQTILIIVGMAIGIAPWIMPDSMSVEIRANLYAFGTGISLFLVALFYFFLSLGFLSLIGYKSKINGLAIASAVLSAVSLFVPWFTIDNKLVAPTYVFPIGMLIDPTPWLLPIIVAALTIATHCFVIGSVFNGRIGRILIVVGSIFAFSSPFTYFLVFNSLAPWVGLAMPFISTMIAYFAFKNHPKELERVALDLTGLTS